MHNSRDAGCPGGGCPGAGWGQAVRGQPSLTRPRPRDIKFGGENTLTVRNVPGALVNRKDARARIGLQIDLGE